MLNLNPSLQFEKRSVFYINFFLIITVILSLLYNISLKYFFYLNIFTTLLISYFYFKKSRELAKYLIVTNLFIFFYFLYPNIAWFFTEIFNSSSYVFIVFYNILIAFTFLSLSGHKEDLLGNFSKFKSKIFAAILLLGTAFGLIFAIIKEPIPNLFTNVINSADSSIIGFILFSSFLIAFSEQMIFSGFLFNIYSKLTSKKDAIYQASIIFVLFHLLRFEILVKHYFVNFNELFLIYLITYYILLFIFMVTALYLYSFKSKKHQGNFFYPVALHFAADFSLFLFYAIGFQ
jgi:membrane protease YdiL (CAAX protease family)